MEPFFFQLLDRVRFQAALNALGPECKSLALISPVQALAEHYKDAVLEKLQVDWPGHEIKSFFPADSDSIVLAFNQMVSEMSVTQALDRRQGQSGLKLWLVHNANALPEHELLLLLQLLEKFPGAKVRALLLYAGTEAIPDGLDGFEKSLMKWVVERPALVQIKETMSREHDPERQALLRDLIQRMAPGSIPPQPTEPTPGLHAQDAPASRPAARPQKTTLRSWLVVSGIALLVLVGSLVATYQMHSGSSSKPLVNGVFEWMFPSSEAEASKSDVTAKAETSSPADTDRDQRKADQGRSDTPSPEKSSAVEEASGGQTSSVKTEVITEWPDEVVTGEKWAWQLKVSQFIIQHSIDPSFEKTMQTKAKYPDLKLAQVIPQFVGTETQARFALISGPYATKAEAESYLKSHDLPKQGWVRNAGAMQERLMIKSTVSPKP